MWHSCPSITRLTDQCAAWRWWHRAAWSTRAQTGVLTLLFIHFQIAVKYVTRCEILYPKSSIIEITGVKVVVTIDLKFTAYHRYESLKQKWTTIPVKLQFKWEILFQNGRPMRRWPIFLKNIWKSRTNSVQGSSNDNNQIIRVIEALLLPPMLLRPNKYLNKQKENTFKSLQWLVWSHISHMHHMS